VDKDKKSFEEKSIDVEGAMLRARNAELTFRFERRVRIDSSRAEDFIFGVEA
jgi:hypothetical protein